MARTLVYLFACYVFIDKNWAKNIAPELKVKSHQEEIVDKHPYQRNEVRIFNCNSIFLSVCSLPYTKPHPNLMYSVIAQYFGVSF